MKIKQGLMRAFRAMEGSVFAIILFLAVIIFFVGGLSQASKSQSDEALRVAREGIVRAALSCYAIEGAYPADFQYLKKNYAISIDEGKYLVDYNIFASNIMPDITVLKK